MIICYGQTWSIDRRNKIRRSLEHTKERAVLEKRELKYQTESDCQRKPDPPPRLPLLLVYTLLLKLL